MNTRATPDKAAAAADPHWVEVIDGQGRFPARLLGPYANAPQAGRACRAVLRLLNPARYTAWVRSQGELQTRDLAWPQGSPQAADPAPREARC